MEDNGIALDEIDKNMFKLIRMYVALSMDVDVKTAGKEITEHMKSGGDIKEISDVMSQMMEDSDFFRTEPKNKDQTSSARTKKKKSESEDVIS